MLGLAWPSWRETRDDVEAVSDEQRGETVPKGVKGELARGGQLGSFDAHVRKRVLGSRNLVPARSKIGYRIEIASLSGF